MGVVVAPHAEHIAARLRQGRDEVRARHGHAAVRGGQGGTAGGLFHQGQQAAAGFGFEELDELAAGRSVADTPLALEFDLSRSTVRRVLANLKRHRLITQRVGSGTYVCEQVHEALAELNPGAGALAVSPAELMAARLVLEPAVIEMAIGNATGADFARMDECNHGTEQATTLEEFEKWDAAFHAAIAEAAHNGFITSMFRLMAETRAQNEWSMLKRRSATPERRLQYQQQHPALAAALKDRDAAKARALCLAHLVQVRTNLLGY